MPHWWPAATLVALAIAATLAVVGMLSTGGGSDDQTQPGSPSPEGTDSKATVGTPGTPAACPTDAPESSPEPTLFETLSEDSKLDAPNFEANFKAEVSDDSAQSSADLTLEMEVRAGDVAAAAFYISIPEEWDVTPGCQIPLGLTAGTLRWDTTLGLDGGPCNRAGPLLFNMLNASTDPSDNVEFLDADANGALDFAEDKDHNGRADAIDKYPNFLTRLFPDRRPLRRLAGIVTYTDPPVLAQSLLFESLEGSDGITLVLVLQDIGDPEAAPGQSGFTDYCTPTAFRMTDLGSAQSGAPFYTNPGPDVYTFTLTAFGERDAEGDGIENALDSCPFDVNVGDPRVRGDGDADDDGLDAACDPSDFETNPDQDDDGHHNRADLCPLTKATDSSVQPDADEDDIGDECDESGNGPEVGDGDVPAVSQAADVTIR
jgi:hypothetical protein